MTYNPNDSHLQSWLHVPPAHDFPIQNLPFGIFETESREPRPGVAIGDCVLDLAELGLMQGPTLDAARARALRPEVSWLLNKDNPALRDDAARIARCLLQASNVRMHLPFAIGDYVDFYSSLEHASNVGRMFRDPANPLLPNWRWLPVGYHGKSGTVIPSPCPVRRPCGQLSKDNASAVFAPSQRLDIELETGFFIAAGTAPGQPIPIGEAERNIFGMVLLNDWSARDIQRWEYQPLGPFLGKSFATSISPWVVTLEALEPFRTAGPAQQPEPLPYLRTAAPHAFDIQLEVWLQRAGAAEPRRVCRTNFKHLYWSMAQQLAHLTSNGASVRMGDLCGSGTISGPTPDSLGSLLEIGAGAADAFLNDGDTVILRGWCEGSHRIGFGECRGTVLPA